MPRPLSKGTMAVHEVAWQLPFCSVPGLVALLGGPKRIKPARVNNVLRRAERRGLMYCVNFGCERDVVLRWVYSESGIAWGESLGFQRDWWHSRNGIKEMAKRIRLIEAVERISPNYFRSELLSDSNVYVFRHAPVIDPLPGKATTKWFLDEAYWAGAYPVRFHWLKNGPIGVVVEYRTDDLAGPDHMPVPEESFYLPFIWLGRFHRRSVIEDLRRSLGQLLQMRPERVALDMEYTVYGDYFPGAVAVCSDGAVAAMVNRHYCETHGRRERRVNLAIVDVQGNIFRRMDRPTNWWSGINVPALMQEVGNIGREIELLQEGVKKAVNGRRAWRVFLTVATRPGSTALQIAGISKTLRGEARGFLNALVKTRAVCLWRQGYYLVTSGRSLYAGAERATASRVLKQLGQYAVADGAFRKGQRFHNWGSTEVCLALQEQGYSVFSALGMSIDYYVGRRLYRVTPDAYVLLPPGILVAIEYERSAKTPRALARKLGRYENLAGIKKPVPVLFITETDEAADLIAGQEVAGVLCTTLERLKAGPQGRAVVNEAGQIGGDPGCWFYCYKDHPAPKHHAPIDLWTQSESEEYSVWRVPLGLDYWDVALADWSRADDPEVWARW